MAQRTRVLLEVNNEVTDIWSSYNVHVDLLHGSGGFALQAPMLPKERLVDIETRDLRTGAAFKLYVVTPKTKNPVLVQSGYICDVDIHTSRQAGTAVSVRGRDVLGDVVDADVLPSIAMDGVSFGQVARKILVDQFGFSSSDILVSNDANRALTSGKADVGVSLSNDAPINLEEMKLSAAHPQPGETAFAFLHRHAVRLGLLIWATGDGKVVIGRPNYNTKPASQFRCLRGGNTNVQQIDRKRSDKQLASEIMVFGHSSGGDAYRGPVFGSATDENLRLQIGAKRAASRILTLHDQHAKTKAQCEHRARYELSVRRQHADMVHIATDDHADEEGTVYAIDTMNGIEWDDGSISGLWYTTGLVFSCSRDAGTETTLDLVPPHSIALGDGTATQIGGAPTGVAPPFPAAAKTPDKPVDSHGGKKKDPGPPHDSIIKIKFTDEFGRPI